MNKQLLLVAFSLGILLAGSFSSTAGAQTNKDFPALVIMRQYEKELPYMDFFEPYNVCILALNELEHGRMLPEIKNYIKWYFEHLNYPDKHKLTGTIYDYVIRDGQERATRKYDSIGAYSGVFLHLLDRYVSVTGDTGILKENWKKIEDITYTIVYMQDPKDSLMRVLPTTDQKKLADNCEAYGGIRAYNQLRRHLGMGRSKFYASKEEEFKNAILGLYRSSYNSFIWMIEDGRSRASNWDTFYPDAYVQLLPVYYGLLEYNYSLGANLLYNFDLRHEKDLHKLTVEQRIIYELTKRKLNAN